jgi:hypothetical protein
MAFHSREGWYFAREPDGSVTIQRRLPIKTAAGDVDGWPVEHVRLDANTWQSVIASMSWRGENGQTFQEAEQFHMGIEVIPDLSGGADV